MKKLTKEQFDQKWQHINSINEAAKLVEEAIDAYKAQAQMYWDEVEEAVAKYNEAISQASEFKDEVCSEAQEYYDERSEKWQESEKGKSYQEWIDEWESCLDEIEVEQPEELEVPDMEAPDILENLPDEPNS
jgi:uncharacterized coiled-coil DUF342 family protein